MSDQPVTSELSALPERLAREAADRCAHYDYYLSPPCDGCVAAAIRAALDEAAKVARTCDLTWEETGDGVRREIASAIEALKA